MSDFKKRNVKKFCDEKYEIKSPFYYNQEANILVLSDLHFHEHVDKELWAILVKYCEEVKPDYIVMPGDLFETSKFLENEQYKNSFELIIKLLASISKVIMVPGNHEVMEYIWGINSAKKSLVKYLESMSSINNVHVLNDAWVDFGNIRFLGYSPDVKTYFKKSDETKDLFIEGYIQSGLKMDSKKYNVFVTHCPMIIEDPYVKNSVFDFKNNTDLVISGHFHDGYLPKILDKYYKNTNAGLVFTPFSLFTSKYACRGMHDFGRGYLFVSQGFRKYTADILPFNFFEMFTANDVEQISISSSDDYTKTYKRLK